MKRIISLSLALVMIVSMASMTVSCDSILEDPMGFIEDPVGTLFKHPIEKFYDDLVSEKNYQLDITMKNVPLFGTFSVTTKVDGNISYTPAILWTSEQFVETDGKYKYTYTKDSDGEWSVEKERMDNDASDYVIMADEDELFNPDNYEQVKGEKNVYEQKKGVNFEEYSDVVMTLEDGKCIIECVSNDGGYDCEIVFSKVGEIELTLPDVD